MSPGCSMKCSPVRVWKSSVPLNVMTNWRAGASCHSKAPPALVSRNEMLIALTVPLRMSPRSPLGRSMTPSSKYELLSFPVQSRIQRIIGRLLVLVQQMLSRGGGKAKPCHAPRTPSPLISSARSPCLTPPHRLQVVFETGVQHSAASDGRMVPIRLETSPALGHQPLGIGNRARRVEAFWAGLGAVHDGMAAIEAERVLQPGETLAGALIAAVGEPAIGLQQDRRAEIAVLVPPVARAGGRAAEAEDALPQPVQLGALLLRLVALAIRRRLVGLQPGLDQLVLRIQSAEIGNEILQHLHMRQRRDPARPLFEAVHWGQTRQCVDPVDIHRAGAAHPFPARPPESESRVDLVVDLDQGIENHRPAVIAIDVEGVHRRVGVLRRVPAIDPEALDVLCRLRKPPVLAIADL